MKFQHSIIAASILALSASGAALAQEKTLRLLTWADYAPADIVAQFEKESGYKVEVTLSNNEEMISKLRATGGAGFDLAQPSQDRITGPQQEFGIYKPMDLSKLKSELFIPSMLDATKKNTTLTGKVYGLQEEGESITLWRLPLPGLRDELNRLTSQGYSVDGKLHCFARGLALACPELRLSKPKLVQNCPKKNFFVQKKNQQPLLFFKYKKKKRSVFVRGGRRQK